MKIGEVKFEQRKNLGDWNHVNVTVSALVEEDDTASAVIEKLRKLVKWHLNADEYEAKYNKLMAQAEKSETETVWLAAYDERKKVIEAI